MKKFKSFMIIALCLVFVTSSVGVFGAVAGVTGLPLPKFLITAISSAGACMSPLAMILTGFIVANYSLKTLASQKRIYLASILRLIILPSIFVIVLKLLKNI